LIERIVLVYADRGDIVDGIRDHTEKLAQEFERSQEVGRGAIYVELSRARNRALGSGPRSAALALAELSRMGPETALFVQYNPFSYGRWGFAPLLPAALSWVRLRGDRPKIVLMVHEPYVPMISWRWVVLGIWQRLQLAGVRYAADVVFASIESWATRFGAGPPIRPAEHLPVGSNFPDRRADRELARRDLGVDDDRLVVATIGGGHPSWPMSYIVDAVNAIAAAGIPMTLLLLGAEAPPLPDVDERAKVDRPTYLDHDALASKLSAADLFLSPRTDGVSTRRGTLMAAMQHGLPILGTHGYLTDAVLLEERSGLRLTPADDPDAFVREAVGLASDPEARKSMGAAARTLYESEFDWPVTVRRVLDTLT
jgi:glycosyltransferase involved in cell wall biosynthesis